MVMYVNDMKAILRYLKEERDFLHFFLFLKKNECFDKFIHNVLLDKCVNMHNKKAMEECVIYYFRNTSKFLLFIEAFCWVNTNEGVKFWSKIHKKWTESI